VGPAAAAGAAAAVAVEEEAVAAVAKTTWQMTGLAVIILNKKCG
jgi:hypothetical protein